VSFERLLASARCTHNGIGVHRRAAAGVELEVGVRWTASGVTGVADVTNEFALRDLPRTADPRLEVEVVVGVAVVTVEVDAVTSEVADLHADLTRNDRDVRCSEGCHEVNALVPSAT
jgi:hypothetical protein